MHGEQVDTKFEVWHELIVGIRALSVNSYDIAERLRSWRIGGPEPLSGP